MYIADQSRVDFVLKLLNLSTTYENICKIISDSSEFVVKWIDIHTIVYFVTIDLISNVITKQSIFRTEGTNNKILKPET